MTEEDKKRDEVLRKMLETPPDPRKAKKDKGELDRGEKNREARYRIEHNPAALLTGCGKHFLHHRQWQAFIACLQIQQYFAPALRRLPSGKMLLATRVDTHDHQRTQPLPFRSQCPVDAIRRRYIPRSFQTTMLPGLVLGPPICFRRIPCFADNPFACATQQHLNRLHPR